MRVSLLRVRVTSPMTTHLQTPLVHLQPSVGCGQALVPLRQGCRAWHPTPPTSLRAWPLTGRGTALLGRGRDNQKGRQVGSSLKRERHRFLSLQDAGAAATSIATFTAPRISLQPASLQCSWPGGLHCPGGGRGHHSAAPTVTKPFSFSLRGATTCSYMTRRQAIAILSRRHVMHKCMHVHTRIYTCADCNRRARAAR